MRLPPKPVPELKQLCIIDYLSFTWCPAEIEPIRRVAQSGKHVFPYSEEGRTVRNMADFIKYREEIGDPLNVDKLEFAALDELKTFFMSVGKDIFANCEYSTADLWEDHFQLIERAGGVFGYRRAFDLVLDGHIIGLAASGGQQGSCYVSVTGNGCRLLDLHAVHRVLRGLPLVKLTRVDVALDDFAGVTGGYDAAEQAFLDDQFVTRGKPPQCDRNGSGGVKKAGTREIEYTKGRTFYVGSRAGGKLYRGYEKGKQGGDTESLWFRHEVELRSSNREIPLHILTKPDQYFAGFYPWSAHVLELVAEADAATVPEAVTVPIRKRDTQSVKMAAVAQYNRSVENARRVVGGVINVMRKARGLSDEQIIDQLIRDAVPRSMHRVAVPGLMQ